MQPCPCETCAELYEVWMEHMDGIELRKTAFMQLVVHPAMMRTTMYLDDPMLARMAFRQIIMFRKLMEDKGVEFPVGYDDFFYEGIAHIYRTFKDQPPPFKCAHCHDDADKGCGHCKVTAYCSRECQAQHWRDTHKKQCKLVIKALEELEKRGN